MRRDHSKLAPVLCIFVPKGRGATDKVLYKLMNWKARKDRQRLWDEAQKAIREMLLYGTSTSRITW